MSEQEHARQEDQLVVGELDRVGVAVRSTQDLMHTKQPYPDAIPVLVRMLSVVQGYTMKEIIARTLGTKEARGHAEGPLISLFSTSLSDDSQDAKRLRWAIANSLDILGSKGISGLLLPLLRDPRSGSARGPLILAAAKTKDPAVIDDLLELLNDDDVTGFAAAGLGILRAKQALSKLKEIAQSTKNAWIRREALAALRRLGVRDMRA
jgi:hypothetical protein